MTVGLFSATRCDSCGRFAVLTGGASTAMMFDMVGMCPDHEAARCGACTRKLGPVQSNARPANGDMTPYQSIYEDRP